MLEMFPGVARGSGSVTGQFSAFQLHHWRGITDNKWLLDTLEKGYCLQFRHRPKVSTQVHPPVVRYPHQVLALSKEIQNLLEKGAIEPVDPRVQPGGFHSKYFLVRKKDGSFRPIQDLRRLNESLKRLPFRMLRIVGVRHAIDPGMWFTSVDLKDAYFHIPITPHHRRFLRFTFQSRTYQFRVLPFGLYLSPRVFTRVIQVALEPLQREGMLILPYLDDWLLCARSYQQAVNNTQRLWFHVATLGLRVNFQKSCLTPSQSVCFLGMQLNSRAMRATLTVGRWQVLQGTLARFQVHYKLPFISFLRLAGLLTAASSVIQLGLLQLRPFQRWLIARHLSPVRNRCTLVRVKTSCAASLRHWRRDRFLQKGVPVGPPPARREVVTTDASLSGWGGLWRHRGVRGSWNPQLRASHINLLELWAVFLTLRHFRQELSGRHILLRRTIQQWYF